MPKNMPVKQRIAFLKQIFADFGIPVPDNSRLALAIESEFGRGKNSKLNQIISELTYPNTSASLAACIGEALQDANFEPGIQKIGNFMQSQLVHIVEILDYKQSNSRKINLLIKILDHFISKLYYEPRLCRLLTSAKHQLLNNNAKFVGESISHFGKALESTKADKIGQILSVVTPAILSINDQEVLTTQKVKLCLNSINIIANNLNSQGLSVAATVLNDAYYIFEVCKDEDDQPATIQDALRDLGISVGSFTLQRIISKGAELGIKERELKTIFHKTNQLTYLSDQQQELVNQTFVNQKYAVLCSTVAKIGTDSGCAALEKIGVSGLGYISLIQTYTEIKSGEFSVGGLSESLGIILSSLGIITDNNILSKLGNCISTGVSAYAGLIATTAGSTVAIPLAICTGISSYVAKHKVANEEPLYRELLTKIIKIQSEYRVELAHLYDEISSNHREIISKLDQAFLKLSTNIAENHYFEVLLFRDLHQEVIAVHNSVLNNPITDLLLQLRYARTYANVTTEKLEYFKQQLTVWLIYKNSKKTTEIGLWLQAANCLLWIISQSSINKRLINDLRDQALDIRNKLLNLEEPAKYERLNAWIHSILAKLKPENKAYIAKTPQKNQLEKFSPFEVNIAQLWEQEIKAYIPNDYIEADKLGVGNLYFNIYIDPNNKFADLKLPYTAEIPSEARAIKFRLEVTFGFIGEQVCSSIVNFWFKYNLNTAQQRFHEYYEQKFVRALRHKRYNWISIDGSVNELAGYPATACHPKQIDYEKLGNVYLKWWQQSSLFLVEELTLLSTHLLIQYKLREAQELRGKENLSSIFSVPQLRDELEEYNYTRKLVEPEYELDLIAENFEIKSLQGIEDSSIYKSYSLIITKLTEMLDSLPAQQSLLYSNT